MPPSKAPKIRRKDLRQPDEFESVIGQAWSWVQDHLQLAVGAGAVVLVVALGVALVGRSRVARNDAAAAAFRTAQVSFQAGKFDAAAAAFAAVVSDYAGTSSAHLATLYRAHALARKPDPAAAASAYGDYLTAPDDPPYLRQEALVGLARARAATGDTAGALDAYQQAGALQGPYQVDALLGAARLDEASGRPDRAREVYGRLLKDATDPDLRALLLAKVPPGTDTAKPATASD